MITATKQDHIPRYTEMWLQEYLLHLQAVMIDGPKGVGKTQTAMMFAKSVWQLDQESQRESLATNYDVLYDEEKPILLDEWQHLPEVWDRVRRMVDNHILPGSLILTGSIQSNNPNLHSGAGRIIRHRMRPLSLAERIQAPELISLKDCLEGNVPQKVWIKTEFAFPDYVSEILRSGFPQIRNISNPAVRRNHLDSYLSNITSHEFASQGITIRQPEKLRAWMRAYAAATATTTSYNKMLDAASSGESDKPAKETVIAYREALNSLWLIDDLPYWDLGENYLGHLKQTPKHYLADPALEARLLRLSCRDLITGKINNPHDKDYGSTAGRLFESLCALSVRTYATALDADVSYARTRKGNREIDFVVQLDQSIVAIEAKMSSTVSCDDVQHLNWFAEKVGERVQERIILTTGNTAYRRTDGVLVIPAALFG